MPLLAILAYVWFRFEWQFAVRAVVALIHDAVTTVGLFALFGLEFNLTSIAAIFTIIGYSINDTVVIHDRVRSHQLPMHAAVRWPTFPKYQWLLERGAVQSASEAENFRRPAELAYGPAQRLWMQRRNATT